MEIFAIKQYLVFTAFVNYNKNTNVVSSLSTGEVFSFI